MNTAAVMDIVRQAMMVLAVVSLPVLVVVLVVSITGSLLQAMTQITDPTITFVPKILAVFIAVLLMGPWMLEMMVDFAKAMFGGN